ncbi:unnamed protein product [Bursaphelenchus okinawaensis]|uniref:Thioredoxin domain-containing protein n=1 Tax=Bursaphelenchus okinawaensis TaxID=465554 RepID=A0A811K368_9BILA|nr:unnamed protein product [Bursaphelenchus okinawaensis]CAG9090393.1 unnamed protein product [Bursaphelenchus okinawaensis]
MNGIRIFLRTSTVPRFLPASVTSTGQIRLKSTDGNDKDLGKDLGIDVNELSKKLDETMGKPVDQQPGYTPPSSDYMSFRKKKEESAHERSYIFGWKSAAFTLGMAGITCTILLYFRKIKLDEEEKRKKQLAGKARIGGEWELVNQDGKREGSKELIGNWILMYFGFTNCPDICPDEIEKMVDIVDMLDREKDPVPVVPVFITVDPLRDSVDRVKKYCAEFSPKIRGYTGSKEEIEKVLKTFRIYHSQGPSDKRAPDDYIVDHTVIMYLIDPEGNFFDYYGQNRRASEIANVIRTKVLQYERKKKVGWF